MTLTKRDLILRISKHTGMKQVQVQKIVQRSIDEICEALAKGDKVELRNFGVFEVKTRGARVGRNPNLPGSNVPIPERTVVRFKAGKQMRMDVRRLREMSQQNGTNPPPAN
jgi:nucleoid DNA-binding protein